MHTILGLPPLCVKTFPTVIRTVLRRSLTEKEPPRLWFYLNKDKPSFIHIVNTEHEGTSDRGAMKGENGADFDYAESLIWSFTEKAYRSSQWLRINSQITHIKAVRCLPCASQEGL